MNAAQKALASVAGMDFYTAPGTLEKFAVLLPRTYKPDGRTPLVFYCHGAGGNGVDNLLYADAIVAGGFSTSGIYRFAQRIAEAGYPVISGDFGGVSTWGNPTAVGRIEAARAWMQGPPYYAKPGPVVMTGGSMGGVNCVNYYRTYPANVLCTVRLIPVSDLDDIRNFNRGGYRDWVNVAWGTPNGSTADYPVHGTSLAVLPGIGNPAIHLGELANLPDLVYYATDDAIIYPPSVVTLSNATATKESHPITGFGGHSDATIDQTDMTRVLAFLAAYAPLPTGEAY